MTPLEILNEIFKLQPGDRRIVEDTLANDATKPLTTEDEFIQLLLADGVISSIPSLEDDPEFDEYEPIVVEGEPLSEMIIRERR